MVRFTCAHELLQHKIRTGNAMQTMVTLTLLVILGIAAITIAGVMHIVKQGEGDDGGH